MVRAFWRGGKQTIYQGDAWRLAAQLKPESIDCIVTSPPYWGLRDYGLPRIVLGGKPRCKHRWGSRRLGPLTTQWAQGAGQKIVPGDWSKCRDDNRKRDRPDHGAFCAKCDAWRGHFGLEPHPQLYIDHLVGLFVQLRPALKPTATIWLNLGDTYFSNPSKGAQGPQAKNKKAPYGRAALGPIDEDNWLRPKQLLMMPARVAVALQNAGFLLRNDMLWVKRNAMPCSARDRLTCRYEHIFLFTLNPRYYFDLDAVREPLARTSITRISQPTFDRQTGGKKDYGRGTNPNRSARKMLENLAVNPTQGKNPGDVREWATQPFPDAHFAVFPRVLPEWCLTAGCPRQVCVRCGKPKQRNTRVRYVESAIHGKGSVVGRHYKTGANNFDGSGMPRLNRVTETLGFEPTCSCKRGFCPGVVLDPFLGSGTTLMVAKELGLRGIGFELSAKYCRMAARRINDAERGRSGSTAGRRAA